MTHFRSRHQSRQRQGPPQPTPHPLPRPGPPRPLPPLCPLPRLGPLEPPPNPFPRLSMSPSRRAPGRRRRRRDASHREARDLVESEECFSIRGACSTARRAWRQEWCCEHHQKGCPFDCQKDADQWTSHDLSLGIWEEPWSSWTWKSWIYNWDYSKPQSWYQDNIFSKSESS